MESICQQLQHVHIDAVVLRELYYFVDVVQVNHTYHFYTRLKKFRALVESIENLCPTNKIEFVTLHGIVLFNLNRDSNIKKYVRGQIHRIAYDASGIKCDIFALDYGYYEQDVSIKHVWACNSVLANIPPLAMRCKIAPSFLRNCSIISAIEYVQKYVGRDRVVMFVEDNKYEYLSVMLSIC